ncbi:MAG TPA: CoA pyrophosphatase [Cyclobacteriaceae bacterium]|nr:CoA pyrophosphatase [Cyclobacteriaceae bacterium]
MIFEQLIGKLEVRLGEDLPAALAHEGMRATRSDLSPIQFNHSAPPRPGAVLLLIYPGPDGAINFPLIKRPDYAGTHSGQVSFPGGKAEPGETIIQTALREAQEEIGVNPEDVNVIGVLSEFFVMPSNFMVTPVVGYMNRRPDFIPDKIEVVRVLEGDIRRLMPDEAITVSEIVVQKTYKLMAPHFLIDNEIVWGATAMMLNEFRYILKDMMEPI